MASIWWHDAPHYLFGLASEMLGIHVTLMCQMAQTVFSAHKLLPTCTCLHRYDMPSAFLYFTHTHFWIVSLALALFAFYCCTSSGMGAGTTGHKSRKRQQGTDQSMCCVLLYLCMARESEEALVYTKGTNSSCLLFPYANCCMSNCRLGSQSRRTVKLLLSQRATKHFCTGRLLALRQRRA